MKHQPTPLEPLWTIEDVAAFLRVSIDAARHMRRQRQLPEPIKMGRSLRWRRSDLEAWAAEGGTRAKTEGGGA